jgi:MFS family permease
MRGAVPVVDVSTTGARTFHAVIAVAGVGFGLTAPFTAVLVTAMQGSAANAAVVVSAMGISLLICDTFGSRLIPRMDSKLAISGSMVIFGLGSLITALATTWHLVGLARIGLGFGAALFMSGGMHLALALARRGDEANAIGAFNAAWFAGVATGPLGGGLIASILPGSDGLRLLFGVCAGINFVGAVLGWFLIPRVPGADHTPVRQLPRLIGLPRNLEVKGLRVWGALGLVGIGQGVRSAIAMTLIPLVAEGAGLGWAAIGVALAALALTDVTSMQRAPSLSERHGRRTVLVVALAVGSVPTALLAVLPASTPLIVALSLVVGVTVGTTWVVPAAMIVDLLPDRENAVVAYRIASDLGMLASGLIAGAALLFLDVRTTLAIGAGLLLLSIILALAVGETRRSIPTNTGGSHAVPID